LRFFALEPLEYNGNQYRGIIMTKLTMALLSSALILSSLTSPMPVYADQHNNVTDNKAGQHAKHSGERKQQMKRTLKRLAKHLQLTQEQKQQVKNIFKQNQVERMANIEALKGFKDQMKSLMTSTTFDDKVFLDLHSQYQGQFAQVALLRAKSKHAFFQVLNEEQREKLTSLKGKVRGLF